MRYVQEQDKGAFVESEMAAAVSRYMVHSEMSARFGYGRRPANLFRQYGDDRCSGRLVSRVLMLEEIPDENDLKWPRFNR